MGDYWDHRPIPETAVLVGVIRNDQSPEQAEEYLAELAFLAKTAGAETRAVYTQRLETSHPKTFIGSGKLAEVKEYFGVFSVALLYKKTPYFPPVGYKTRGKAVYGCCRACMESNNQALCHHTKEIERAFKIVLTSGSLPPTVPEQTQLSPSGASS